MPRQVILLGPQRLAPTVDRALADLGDFERVAIVTAGWEEREGEDEEFNEILGGRAVNLDLHERSERVWHDDPELFTATRERAAVLREVQDLYRVRLAHELEAARELLRRASGSVYLDDARFAAIDVVRRLDYEHVARVNEVREAFDADWRPHERDAVAEQRGRISGLMESAGALCVAGGHVGVLLSTLRLFDVVALAADRAIVAWAAGAMVLSDRIVLFHDSPPQGPGNAEVLEQGLGVAPGVVPLPNASQRLRLKDRTRVALFARRFRPALCIAMDQHTRIDWDGTKWVSAEGLQHLTEAGDLAC